jgi:hypothetical protein
LSDEKKEEPLFPRFKKRELKRGKILVKKEHRKVVAPAGE